MTARSSRTVNRKPFDRSSQTIKGCAFCFYQAVYRKEQELCQLIVGEVQSIVLGQLVRYLDTNWITDLLWIRRKWSDYQTSIRTNNNVEAAMVDWMGNRQKGSSTGVKLVASKKSKLDEQVRSVSLKTQAGKFSGEVGDISDNKHAHTNLGMLTDGSLDNSTVDSSPPDHDVHKMALLLNSDTDSDETRLLIGPEAHIEDPVETKKLIGSKIENTVETKQLIGSEIESCVETKQLIESEVLIGDNGETKQLDGSKVHIEDSTNLHKVVDLHTDLHKKEMLNHRNDDKRKKEELKSAAALEDHLDLNDAAKDICKLPEMKPVNLSKLNQREDDISGRADNKEMNILTGKSLVLHFKKNDNIKPDSADIEKTQHKTTEDDYVEKVGLLIEKLNSADANLTEPLASLSQIVRGQTDSTAYSELHIAAFIKHGFTQKFEHYLSVNSINSIAEIEKDGNAKVFWPTVKRFLMLIWIACDQSVNFCQHILASDLFYVLQKDLQRLCFLNYSDSELKTFTVKSVLGILHNICRHVPNGKWKLRNDGVVSVVRLYLQSEVPMIRLKSFIILSYIISEAENEMINSDDDNFEFIFKVLGDALQSENHKSSKYGMGVVEVMKGLSNLAINDENKIRIVRNGGLQWFQAILESGGADEIKVTITTLWSLAFHHYNKVKMREMPAIMSKLYELQHCKDEEICHAARGTFWELENISKSSIGSRASSSLSADKDPGQPHIMISYQWDSQAIMMKVKDRLRHAGYKVWMDIEHMTGSTLEAMALAVEKAAVILICMSQKYKDSPNCRTEAEYVYRLRKDFVPLRLQKEYIPDGWLGILVGTRLYFDIYSEDYLDTQVPRLTRELRDRGRIMSSVDRPDSNLPIVPQRMTSREAVPILHQPVSPTVSNWTSLDVKRWIASLGLDESVHNFEEINGPLLLELQKIQETAPEYFHSILRKDFDLPVMQALKLSRFLRQLS